MTTLATIVYLTWALDLAAGLWAEMWWKHVRKSDLLEKFWRATGRIHQELWLFAPPGLLINSVNDWHRHPWLVFFDALGLFNWWNFRNWPEDNHWKRRAKKAKESVQVRGARLVVVSDA